VATERALRFVW